MKRLSVALSLVVILSFACPSFAHFQLLIPSKVFVEGSPQKLEFFMPFTHPMEGGPIMDVERPAEFGFSLKGERKVLKDAIKAVEVEVFPSWHPDYKDNRGKKARAYKAEVLIDKPGDYIFYLIPQPYFESQEGRFIWQITKVIVNAFGAEEGWDRPLGLKAEIVPLVKPYALWVGNEFKGKVLIDGKPASNIDVEIEYYNEDGKIKDIPSDAFVTQVVKTDENGIFSYVIPWAGWWGFAAIGEGGEREHQSKRYPIELDAVIWIKAFPVPEGVKR
ncbi:MAG: DUF4198 domain-containing protein [Synergistetes bacterium]|nr:DUF4198 domain-containing protein [Synergistota bacterium]MDW8191643.1 DUF4198 domain-containing protein [Synergistota bacterium]